MLALAWLLGTPSLRAEGLMEVYDVLWSQGMEEQKLRASWDGATLRIDVPDEELAVLCREKEGTFIGLELRDAYDWKFNWPALQAVLQRQKNQTRNLEQNILTGDNSINLLGNVKAPSHEEPPTVVTWETKPDSPGTWIGTGSPRGSVEADESGATGRDAGRLAAFWLRYAQAADIIRTVAVRELAPSDLLPLISGLPAEKRNIAILRWYRNGEKAEVVKVSAQTEPLDPTRFRIPASFRETKLSTLDGVLDEEPAPEKRPSGD